MSEKRMLDDAMLDEMVYLVPEFANVTISAKNANVKIPDGQISTELLILWHSGKEGAIDAGGLEMIDKLITALKLSLERTVLLDLDSSPEKAFNELIQRYHPKKMLLFGITAGDLHLHLQFTEFKSLKFKDVDIVTCYSIKQMDKAAKSALWYILKNLFGI